MNLASILRAAWRITWRTWPLWVLNLLIFFGVVPAVGLAGVIGATGGLLAAPGALRRFPFLAPLERLPLWAWAAIGLAAVVSLIFASFWSWTLQAAAMRGTAIAAERGQVSLIEALHLGRRRFLNLLLLSLTFGALSSVLGVLPPVVGVFLARRFEWLLGLMNTLQAGLAPVNAVLSVVIFLVMMSIALEDLNPVKAAGRAWQVFRQGWVGFLLVYGLTVLMALPWLVLLVPVFLAVPALMFDPRLSLVLILVCCGTLVPLALLFSLFTAVFTTVLYTLVYRAAALQLAALLESQA